MTSPLLYQALLLRLSPRFAVAFGATAVAWTVLALPAATRAAADAGLGPTGIGAVAIAALVAGLVLALWIATAAYRLLPPRPAAWHRPVAASASAHVRPAGGPPLGRYERIGIVLAGGGARGAYQAGALEALHAFLAARDALDRVRALAGTSIGAWNALFWLAGHLARERPTPAEAWWSRIRLPEIVAPVPWIPLRGAPALSAGPWRKAFHALFVEDPAARARLEDVLAGRSGPRFYFTRTSVDRARLEFSTNRDDVRGLDPATGRVRPLAPDDRWSPARTLETLETCVFAALDLPPLLESVEMGGREYEDGGVIENLPLGFATDFEACDLVFVFALNAAFGARAEARGPLERVERVVTIQLGAAERRALRALSLANELAAVRERLAPPDRESPAESDAPAGSPEALAELAARPPAERALARRHVPVQAFAVCPDEPPLLDAMEFWKAREAAVAYRAAREATARLLADFDFDAPPDRIRLALVDAAGAASWTDAF